jgi:hypothetical protein
VESKFLGDRDDRVRRFVVRLALAQFGKNRVHCYQARRLEKVGHLTRSLPPIMEIASICSLPP